MKEHIDAGIHVSLVLVGLLVYSYTRGIVPSLDMLTRLSVLATIGTVVGSDLPDIDAKRGLLSSHPKGRAPEKPHGVLLCFIADKLRFSAIH